MKKSVYIGLISVMSLCCIGCSNENIAIVNGVNITKEEYTKSLGLVINTSEYLKGHDLSNEFKNEKKYKENLQNIVVSFMIDNEVLYQEAINKGFYPTKDEINLKYEEINKIIDNNTIYKKAIENSNFDKEYLLECVTRDLAIEKYKLNFIDNIQITDKEITLYYNENIKDFYIREIDASHILISTLDRNKKMVSDEEKNMLKKNAYDIIEKINNGECFEELAKKYSDDKITGKNGGGLGFFALNDKNIEFSKEVFKLNKGDISTVIETSYGFHIIKVNDERQALKTLENSKAEIRNKIINQKYLEHTEALCKKANIKK